MNRAISLVLFVVIIMVSGNISAAKANGVAICYFHGVEHPAPPVSGRAVRLNYGQAQSISLMAYATQESDNTQEGDNTQGASASLGYGCLGAALGCVAGFAIALKIAISRYGLFDEANSTGNERSSADLMWFGVTVGGTVLGGYLGSRVDTKREEGLFGCGAFITTILLITLISR
jgi:hypothetical protein